MPKTIEEQNANLDITCPDWCTRLHRAGELDVGDVVHEQKIELMGANLDHIDVRLMQEATRDHKPVANAYIWVSLTVNMQDALLDVNESRAVAVALQDASTACKESLKR